MKKGELELIDYAYIFCNKSTYWSKKKNRTRCGYDISENKSLPWKERKIEAINKIKTASMDGKLVECADKISNLESLYNLYQEEGEEVWKSFNKPKEEQKWYYTNMYQAVLMNTTEENMLFDRNKMS